MTTDLVVRALAQAVARAAGLRDWYQTGARVAVLQRLVPGAAGKLRHLSLDEPQEELLRQRAG
jgi:hypothetical protein